MKSREVGSHGFPWLGGYSAYSYHSWERAQVRDQVKQLEEPVSEMEISLDVIAEVKNNYFVFASSLLILTLFSLQSIIILQVSNVEVVITSREAELLVIASNQIRDVLSCPVV